MSSDLRPITPLAAEIVRAGMTAIDAAGDVASLGTLIRRKTLGWTKPEKLQLTTAIAVVAADLARRLPGDVRDEALQLPVDVYDAAAFLEHRR